MRNILITGGAGFIGSHVVDALLAANCSVTAIDNFDSFYGRADKLANLERARSSPNFRILELDICDRSALARAAGNYDAVVHLAAKAGVRPSILNPGKYIDTNVGGTQNVLEFARHCGIPQFVFGSSSSVYGVNPRVPWSEEDLVLSPISPYAATKVSGELMGHVYAHLFGMRFIALRFFTVYGPRQRPDLAIHRFARMMLEGKQIPVFGDGGTRRDYTYVSEIVQGIVSAIDYDQSPYEVINLGTSRTVSLVEMINALRDALGIDPRISEQPDQPGDVPITFSDSSKARRLLGFDPQIPFETGVGHFVQWLWDRRPPINPDAPWALSSNEIGSASCGS